MSNIDHRAVSEPARDIQMGRIPAELGGPSGILFLPR
jgi:hypothetical protein